MTTGTTKGRRDGKGMVLTARDREVVALVARLEALTRVQIAQALSFGSVTRANAVLLRLARHGYLHRRYQPTLSGTRRAVYILGKTGHELVGERQNANSRMSSSSDLFLEHRLFVNDVWLSFAMLKHDGYNLTRWTAEGELRERNLGIIPDAYAEYMFNAQAFAAFIEADLGTESLKRWEIKVSAYTHLAFSGKFAQAFGRRYFRVLVVAPSDRRVDNLRKAIAAQTERIFWLTTRQQLAQSGLFGVIWRRPADHAVKSLTTP